MNKTFIGLLIIAAGAGVFFFLRKQNKKDNPITYNKEWIRGTWKLDSLSFRDSSRSKTGIFQLPDSNFRQYRYEFRKDSSLTVTFRDSLTEAYPHYELNKENQLVVTEVNDSSRGSYFNVISFSKDSLALQSADSIQFFFVKTN